MHHLINSAGIAGPVLFVALEAAITLAFLPRSAGAIVAGAAFGTPAGAVLTWLAMMIGAIGGFWIGRFGRRAGSRADHLVSDERRERIAAWVGRLDRWMQRRGPLALLYTRLIPGMPYTSINYASGMTGIRATPFVIATAIGIAPSAYLLVALGGSITHPTSTKFLVTAGVIVLLGIVAPVVDRAVRRRLASPTPGLEAGDTSDDNRLSVA
jgi:uncharacterized membrane protein YdjX (TVP38/TMEM64 family)